MQTPAGAAMLTVAGGRMTLVVGERTLFATALPGRFTDMCFKPGLAAFTLPRKIDGEPRIELPGIVAEHIALAQAGGADLAWSGLPEGSVALEVDGRHAGLRVQVACRR